MVIARKGIGCEKKMEKQTEPVTTGVDVDGIANLQRVGQQIDDQKTQEAEALEAMIRKVKPIMRLIDKPVYEEYWVHSNRSGGGYDTNETFGRGILLQDDEEETGDTRGSYAGTELYLMRDGSVQLATINGDWSRWQGETSGRSRTFEELSYEEVVKKYDLKDIVTAINEAIAKAQRSSTGKLKMLAKRKAIVDRILG